LIGLGNRRIGFIGSSVEYASCADRLQGYKDALEKAQIPVVDEYIQTCENITVEKAENLAKNLLYKSEPVSAIVAFNDSIAIAVYKAAKDCGVRIPEDLSVVGFDDTPVAAYMSPALTSIWQPSYEKGEKAARLLLEVINTPEAVPFKTEDLSCITMYRDSCAPHKE
jgi:DNA-binding LacI/PurR family transcriptional regulator